MGYQILARKYRPQSFNEVMGQDPSVKTLQNAITLDRLHQAYLFCGARGVGKTSMARIFAKSLNCEKGPTNTPCQQCSACAGITKGNSLEVLEIDGASNTGVDDVRELREQAKYLPASGQYKIYIIDEVHMLSTSAFNALLKILEEPPAHLLFIFATTEPHKIPITILSRCQRFDFRRLSTDELVEHLKNILDQEKLSLETEALFLIANASGGSVRDSLSLLDQVLSFCGQDITTEKVRSILGLSDRTLLFDMLGAILNQDTNTTLSKASDVYEKGGDLKIFSEELLELLRHLMMMQEQADDQVDLAISEKQQLKEIASLGDTTQTLMLFQILSRGIEQLARSDFPKLIFETTLVKMLKSHELVSLPNLIASIGTQTPAPTNRPTRAAPTPPAQPRPAPQRTDPAKAPQATPAPPSGSAWHRFVQNVLETKPQIGAILEHARPLKIEDSQIQLGFEAGSLYADMLKDRMDHVEAQAKQFFKRAINFDIHTLTLDDKLPSSAHEVRQQQEDKKVKDIQSQVLSNPIIQKTQKVLGATLKEVKVLK